MSITCLSNNKIAAGFESGHYIGMILIQIQETFHIVNHYILLKEIAFREFSGETTTA